MRIVSQTFLKEQGLLTAMCPLMIRIFHLVQAIALKSGSLRSTTCIHVGDDGRVLLGIDRYIEFIIDSVAVASKRSAFITSITVTWSLSLKSRQSIGVDAA